MRSGQSRDGLTLGHQRALLRLLEPIGVKEGGEAASPMPLAPLVRHPRVAKGLLDPRPAIGEEDIQVRVGEPRFEVRLDRCPGRRRPRHGLSPVAVASPAGASPASGFGSGPPVDQDPRRGASEAHARPTSPATALGPVPTGGRETSLRPACRDVGTGAQAPHIAPTRPVSRAIFLQILHRAFGDRPRYPCRSAVPATAAPGAGSHGPSSRGARRPRGQRIYRVSAVARPMAPALGRPDEWRRQFRCRHISA